MKRILTTALALCVLLGVMQTTAFGGSLADSFYERLQSSNSRSSSQENSTQQRAVTQYDSFYERLQPQSENAANEATYNNSARETLIKTPLTGKSNTGHNTQTAFGGACCAYIHNGTVYFSLVYKPTIYAYNGTNTVEYNVGGSPSGIVGYGSKIFYLNEDDINICSLDPQSGGIEVIFAKLSEINSFFIYNGTMYISGKGDNGSEIYSLDLNSGSSTSILISQETLKLLSAGNNRLYYLSTGSEHIVCSVDCSGNSVKEIVTLEGNTFDHPVDKKNIYIDAYYYRRDYGHKYYVVYTDNGSYEELSESEYNKKHTNDKRADGIDDGSYYSGNNSSITKTNIANGTTQTLVASSSSKKYTYLTSDENIVVFWSGDVDSRLMARADQYGPAVYSAVTHLTRGYNSAEVYVCRTDGSNMRTIGSLSGQVSNFEQDSNQNGGNTSSLGSTSNSSGQGSQSGICSKCGGSGKITCTVCGGTGKGPAMYMLGQRVEQGCATCGKSGRMVCTECGGSGKR